MDVTTTYIAASADAGGRDWLIGRNNANDVDLNRDFPNLYGLDKIGRKTRVRQQHLTLRQPETEALMDLITSTPFVLSASLHDGDLVAVYPYDWSQTGDYASPDEDTFRHLALSYASRHPDMSRPATPCDEESADTPDGVINGGAWYPLRGGMQDFNYLATDCFEITLELSCDKFPPAERLEEEWKRNKESLLNFAWQVHSGIKGVVRDGVTGKPLSDCIVSVTNVTENRIHINHDVTSLHDGDYFRLLTPGEYEVTARRPGYRFQTKRVVVGKPSPRLASRVDFKLIPL